MHNKEPTFTALGSVYYGTHADELLEAVLSLYGGEWVPDQIVIAVDGPISAAVTKSLEYLVTNISNLSVVPFSMNRGLGVVLSEALNHCHSEYILRFDTDDINLPNRVFEVKKYARNNPNVDIFGSYVYEYPFDPSIFHQTHIQSSIKTVPLTDKAIKQSLFFRNPINHPTVCFKRQSICTIGAYDNYLLFEDYALWIKAKQNELTFGNIDIPLVLMNTTDIQRRRYGLRYAQLELKFLLYIYSCSNYRQRTIYTFFFLFRIISRLFPGKLQNAQRKSLWRTSTDYISNPTTRSVENPVANESG